MGNKQCREPDNQKEGKQHFSLILALIYPSPKRQHNKNVKRISNSQLQPESMTMGDPDILPPELLYEILGKISVNPLISCWTSREN